MVLIDVDLLGDRRNIVSRSFAANPCPGLQAIVVHLLVSGVEALVPLSRDAVLKFLRAKQQIDGHPNREHGGPLDPRANDKCPVLAVSSLQCLTSPGVSRVRPLESAGKPQDFLICNTALTSHLTPDTRTISNQKVVSHITVCTEPICQDAQDTNAVVQNPSTPFWTVCKKGKSKRTHYKCSKVRVGNPYIGSAGCAV